MPLRGDWARGARLLPGLAKSDFLSRIGEARGAGVGGLRPDQVT